MAELRHAPYGSANPPMAIGLKALELAEWIEPDEHLAGELIEKKRLLAERHAEVYAERPASRPAQQEVLALLIEHLPRAHPGVYRRDGSRIHIIPAEVSVEVENPEEAPLECASRLVQEDLVLMARGDTGWQLAAASLCFPSTWVLAEKFGRDMDGIHQPVPGYAEHIGPRLLRIFDNLQVERPADAVAEHGPRGKRRLGWSDGNVQRSRRADAGRSFRELPFAVPDHPLIEAKLELIEERGGDPFTEYSLPEAILKLRQGVGRLIRTKADRGIIVILYNRIVTKAYGRAFMQALPKCPVEII